VIVIVVVIAAPRAGDFVIVIASALRAIS